MQSPLRRSFVYSSVILSLGLILAACQLMPVPTGNPQPKGVDVLPAFNTKADSSGEPEMLTFPSQVTTQRLTAVDQLAAGKNFAVRFSTAPNDDPAHPQHIQVPLQGGYKLTVQPGSAFAIVDADATDGVAAVTLPQATYNAYLKLNGSRSVDQVRSLKVQDNLYYLKDELIRTKKGPGGFTVQANKEPKLAKLQITALCSNDPNDYRVWKITNPNNTDVVYRWSVEQTAQADVGTAPPGDSYLETDTEGGKNTLKLFVADKQQDSQVSKPDVCLPGQEADREESTWWSMGARSLPVPADWHSDGGANQVFSLTNQGVTDFVMRWVKTPGQQVSFPPGIQEIGPAGGTVELPGVAKLEIPTGALSQPTIISLQQILAAPSLSTPPLEKVTPTGNVQYAFEYATPIVKIQPLNLQINKSALLTLQIDSQVYTGFEDYLAALAVGTLNRDNIQNGHTHFSSSAPVNSGFYIKKLGYFAKISQFGIRDRYNRINGFKTNSSPSSTGLTKCNNGYGSIETDGSSVLPFSYGFSKIGRYIFKSLRKSHWKALYS